MAAVPNRAQNYIPIPRQNKNRMKFAAEPKRIQARPANVSYIDDLRIQKASPSSARKVRPAGSASAPAYARPQWPEPRRVYQGSPKSKSFWDENQGNLSSARVSPRGEISVPLPGTGARPQQRPAAKAAPRVATAASAGVVSTILLIAVVFGVLAFLMARNAAITNVSLENAEIQDRIEDLSQEIDQLKLDITLKEDLGAIQDRALELNMATPAGTQITYLTEENTAAAETAADQDTQDTALEEEGFNLNSIFKTVKSWLE